jgi:hypothetical protein
MTRSRPSGGRGSHLAAAGATILVAAAFVACVPPPAGRTTPPPGSAGPTAGGAAITPPPTTGPTPTLTFGRPTATPLPTFLAYRVRTGDTLISIARQFETTPQSIGYWNRATRPTLDPESAAYNPNDIRVGWTLLIIPGAEVDGQELTPPPVAPSDDPAASAEA